VEFPGAASSGQAESGSFDSAQDFGWRLGRRHNASSSTPASSKNRPLALGLSGSNVFVELPGAASSGQAESGSFDYAQDFGWRLGRRHNASSSTPASSKKQPLALGLWLLALAAPTFSWNSLEQHNRISRIGSFDYAQDFGWRLGHRHNASSSTPASSKNRPLALGFCAPGSNVFVGFPDALSNPQEGRGHGNETSKTLPLMTMI